MTSATFDMERSIARCRVMLSVAAILAVYIDPTEPTLTRWLPLTGGPFRIDPYALAVMGSHLGYSLVVYGLLRQRLVSARGLAWTTTWTDVLFGAMIVLVTEGTTSPFYVFFAFAVLATGLRAGFRATFAVTAASVALYLSLIVVSVPNTQNFYIMRPAYLAITGYLVSYLGQERLTQEARIRHLEASAQRAHIARSLHDGYAQALAGVNLRLESCRELFRRGLTEEALAELADLQVGVTREHDELRGYIRSLAEVEARPTSILYSKPTEFSVHADFRGPSALVEHVLHILLEGARNVQRHAGARSAAIDARMVGEEVVVTVDDDGIGFSQGAAPPWSIASRVAEVGGRITLGNGRSTGGRLLVQLPVA
ncbi:MAG TPA: histidine kinase [Candidatus Binatia bacterium]|nr:histidine kinase [Candidatus Binatia bacterium]